MNTKIKALPQMVKPCVRSQSVSELKKEEIYHKP